MATGSHWSLLEWLPTRRRGVSCDGDPDLIGRESELGLHRGGHVNNSSSDKTHEAEIARAR